VAIPVRNGGSLLGDVFGAVRAQRLDRPLELLVADSGSTDGSRELARRFGARLIDVPAVEFSHGGTRNMLAGQARGSHIAFITQDAVPDDERWLSRLLEGFEASGQVGLVFGPYRARADASVMVRRELDCWFGSLPTWAEWDAGARPDLRSSFFTDANGCISRVAWRRVPFRAVAYAEDQLLARDMLAAGFAKVFRPDAVVVHSHDYRPLEQFRRSFDEWRALREIQAIDVPPALWPAVLSVQRAVRDDVTLAQQECFRAATPLTTGALSLRYHLMRAAGAALGSRANRLPRQVRQVCSLEGRAGFYGLGNAR
jgi:rhamnosyltransferase